LRRTFVVPPVFDRASTRATLVAVFTALALETNYTLIGIPNVKLMDALVFIAAFLFGLRVGIGVGVSTWLVYGFVNPYGQADLVLLSFLIAGECFYAIGGAALSRSSFVRDLLGKDRAQWRSGRVSTYLKIIIVFGVVGFQATFAYDILTNFGSWIFKTNTLYQALIIGMITGAPFAVTHEVSNIVFFALVAPVVIVTTRHFGLGGMAKKV
jgi:uncharacterized membrane protein